MFELGIFCVLLLAAGYWATMWTVGRRDDVLHGKFVEAEPETEPEAEPAAAPLPAAPRASAESLQTLLAIIKQDLKEPRRSRPV
jgi:hypothetical protein